VIRREVDNTYGAVPFQSQVTKLTGSTNKELRVHAARTAPPGAQRAGRVKDGNEETWLDVSELHLFHSLSKCAPEGVQYDGLTSSYGPFG